MFENRVHVDIVFVLARNLYSVVVTLAVGNPTQAEGRWFIVVGDSNELWLECRSDLDSRMAGLLLWP